MGITQQHRTDGSLRHLLTLEGLSRAELEHKFMQNASFGGWPKERSQALLEFGANLGGQRDLSRFAKVGA